MVSLQRHRKLFSDYESELAPPSIKDKGSCMDSCMNSKLNFTQPCYSCYDYCVNSCGASIPPLPPPPLENKSKHIFRYLIVTFSVLAAAVLIILGYALYVRFYKRRRQAQDQVNHDHDHFLDEDRGPVIDHPIWYIQTVGLQPSVINSINVCKYKPGDGLVEGTECSICLSEFQEDETLRLLPKCSHAFHIPCIDTWLRSHTNCPMCRAPIVINAGRSLDPEPVVESSDYSTEEVSTRIPENIGESSREMGNVSSQPESGDGVVIRSVDVGNGVKREGLILGDETDDLQPMRRSVSMDSLSALKISLSIANNLSEESERKLDSELEKENQKVIDIVTKKDGESQGLMRLMGSSSSSIGKSLASGSSNMRRSLSCSGRFRFLSMSGRSQRSVLPM